MQAQEDGSIVLDGVAIAPFNLRDVKIPPRLGNTPRIIKLPNGGNFETRDNDKLDALSKRFKDDSGLSLFKLETKLSFIAILLGFAALTSYLLIVKGIPIASNAVAMNVSTMWSNELGDGVLDLLDSFYLSESRLPDDRQKELSELFEQAKPSSSDFYYRLVFRDGGFIGANAFALPNGTIILTDQLVQLAKNDQEILSALLHEVGHVEHRHGLRSVLESSGVALLFTLWVGDAEFIVEWVAALPPLLMQARFSREHEWEADSYALEQMLAQNIDPIHFSSLMTKLTLQSDIREIEKNKKTDEEEDQASLETEDANSPEEHINTNPKQSKEVDEHEEETGWELLQYLSTHPKSEERIDRFSEASSDFNEIR